MASADDIANEIRAHVDACGGDYDDWYGGIATDPDDRLFGDHQVNRKTDAWIYRLAETPTAARAVEKWLVNTLGMDGGPGGGDHNTKTVYAFRKARHTNPASRSTSPSRR